MANDLNHCTFIGRLGKPPESRYMPNGDPVCSFSIAVGSAWKDKQGQKQESTEWVNITAFGKLAEICQKYLAKGSKVYIGGKLKTDEYEKDGIKRYSTKIIANDMQMLDSKDSGAQNSNQAPQRQPAQSGGGSRFDDIDDDIPFATASLARDVIWKKLRGVSE